MAYDLRTANQHVYSKMTEWYRKVEASAPPAPSPRPSWWIDFSRVIVDPVAETALKKALFAACHRELFDELDRGDLRLLQPRMPPPPPPIRRAPTPQNIPAIRMPAVEEPDVQIVQDLPAILPLVEGPKGPTPQKKPTIRSPSPVRVGPSRSFIKQLAAKCNQVPLTYPKSAIWKTVHSKKARKASPSRTGRVGKSPSPPKSSVATKKSAAAGHPSVARPAVPAPPFVPRPAANIYARQSMRQVMERSKKEL